MSRRQTALVIALAAGLTVAAGRYGVGLFTVAEFVHFSINFPVGTAAAREPGGQLPLSGLTSPWRRIPAEQWTGYPTGGLMPWGRQGQITVDIGGRGWLKALL